MCQYRTLTRRLWIPVTRLIPTCRDLYLYWGSPLLAAIDEDVACGVGSGVSLVEFSPFPIAACLPQSARMAAAKAAINLVTMLITAAPISKPPNSLPSASTLRLGEFQCKPSDLGSEAKWLFPNLPGAEREEFEQSSVARLRSRWRS